MYWQQDPKAEGEVEENPVEPTKSEPESHDIVYVPVPKERLDAVYRALAGSAATSPPGEHTEEGRGTAPGGAAVVVTGQGDWTDRMVLQAAAAVQTYRGAAKLLEMVAKSAPKAVGFTAACEAEGLEAKQLRAELGALSKLTSRLFGRKSWPMSVRYNGQGEAQYSMDPQVAEWWLAALADVQAPISASPIS